MVLKERKYGGGIFCNRAALSEVESHLEVIRDSINAHPDPEHECFFNFGEGWVFEPEDELAQWFATNNTVYPIVFGFDGRGLDLLFAELKKLPHQESIWIDSDCDHYANLASIRSVGELRALLWDEIGK